MLCVVLCCVQARFKFLSSISKICLRSYSQQYGVGSCPTHHKVYIEILRVISPSFSVSVIAGVFVAGSATFTLLAS